MRTTTRLALLAVILGLARCATDTTAPIAPPSESDAAFAKTSTPSAGGLQLCKVAGSGIAAGDAFAFDVSLGGVVRVATVTAGSCLDFAVPREGSALTKGYFRNKPADVRQLVPNGTGLVVDASILSAAELGVLLDGSGVQGTGALLLNLAQQLVAADLNILRGVQASPDVLQAVSDANAAIQIATGPPMSITSSLSTAEQSALVLVLSNFNEGKAKPPAPPAMAQLHIDEAVPALAEVQSIVCDPSAACTGIDLAGGSVDAAVAAGATTRVTFTNRGRPALRLCKVVDPPLSDGVEYKFVAGGINVNTAATILVESGDCVDTVLPVASYLLNESVPDGQEVSSIVCVPASQCSNISEQVGALHVAVVPGITTVTFTNRTIIGTLTICKQVTGDLSQTQAYHFSAGGINLNDAGTFEVAHGGCDDEDLLEGAYLVLEAVPTGVAVESITCDPASRCSNVSPSAGALHATVVGGSQTTINFVNRSTQGTLVICKEAGAGVNTQNPFAFSAGGINVTDAGTFSVAAGSCDDEVLTEGNYMVLEAIPPGTAVSAITCEPLNRCANPSLGVGQVTATVVGSGTTTVTYTNVTTLGTLVICKIAGPGVAPGMPFEFVAGGINHNGLATYTVGAGSCVPKIVPAGAYLLNETPAPGYSVTDITCDGGTTCSNISIGVGALHVTVEPGATATVRFTNSGSVDELAAAAPAQRRLAVRPPD